jgi:hypothetical protein
MMTRRVSLDREAVVASPSSIILPRSVTNQAETDHPMIEGLLVRGWAPRWSRYHGGRYDSDCGHQAGDDPTVIGVVGPVDSVRVAVDVARAEGLEQVIARAYDSIDEVTHLARELDAVCQVLLLTGRYSYELVRQSDALRATLQYIPHGGADLYGTLVRFLRARGCQLPRISLDTIEPGTVREAFEDLELEPPEHVLSLDTEDGVRSVEDIVAFHRELRRAGEVDVCLTCVGSVHERLTAEGIASWRIVHTTSVVREALRQAHLAERVALSEATQPAVVLLTLADRPAALQDDGGYDAQRRLLRARGAILDLAEGIQGRATDVDDRTFVVYASRGTVEGALTRLIDGHDGPFSSTNLPADVRAGVGFGASVAIAEQNARLALRMGGRDGVLHVGFPDGEVLRADPGRPATTYRLRETRQTAERVARELGIGPLALTRLTRALRQVDPSAVTASDLALAYGIEARSARRLITALTRAGFATRSGRQGGPRAGRPQTVYRIDMDRLAGAGTAP